MIDERQPGDSEHESPTPAQNRTPGQIDRRTLLRGAALLSVGSLSAPAALSQTAAAQSAPASPAPDASRQLEAQTGRVLRWAGRAPNDWVRPRVGADHNVVIVGGGQSGVS